MDRHIVYPGQIPLDTDLLNAIQDAYYGEGWLASTTLGTSVVVSGLAVTPTSPASLQVNVAPGAIYSLQTVDSASYGSLGTDANQIVKQGLSKAGATLTITPPGTVGQSINYLVQVAFSEADANAVILPYYNASNPSVAWAGPNNSGTAQNTIRKDTCTIGLKAGTPAATGSQTTPSPDAGYTGLYVVTVANGQTTITSGNISMLSTAPFVTPLGQIPSVVQSGTWNYATAGGTVNAVTASITPAPASLTVGLEVNVKLAGPTTGTMTFNLNGLGAQGVVLPDGSAVQTGTGTAGMLVTFKWDGTNWQLWLPLSPQVLNAQVAPAIRVNKTVDQSMSVNVETICTFNSTAFNDLGSLATWNGTDTLTINSSGAGKWIIIGTAGCYQANSSGAAANRIKVSGVKVAEAYSIINSVAGGVSGPLPVVYKLAAGDTIQFAGYVTSGSSGQGMFASMLPFFSAVFLGK